MQKITVHTGRPYDILIDDGLLEQAGDLVRRVSGAKRICLISDSNVYPLYGNRVVQALESADANIELDIQILLLFLQLVNRT